MVPAIMRWSFGMPNNNPGFASVLSGIYSVFGIVGAISLFAQPNSASGAITLLLASLLLLGLTILAAVDTQFFQNWVPNGAGNLSHGLVRYTGPILLGLSLVATIIIFVLMIEIVIRALANS